MPFKSRAQRRWAYSKEGLKALGGIDEVTEWENATKNKNLPEKVKNDNKKEDSKNERKNN